MPPRNVPRSPSSQPAGFPYPQPGDPPNSAPNGHYGRIGIVPWSFSQTLTGLALTLIPWFLFIFANQLSTHTAAPTRPLARGTDIAQGVTIFFVTAILEGIFLIAPLVYALARRPHGSSRIDGLRALGFRRAPLGDAFRTVLAGILLVFAASYLYGLLVDHFRLGLHTNVQSLLDQLTIEPVTVLCTLAGAVLIAPICEETFFRGFAFAGLLRGVNLLWATLLSAVLFTLAHGDLGSSAPLLILGLFLAYLRWRSGSIWPAIALHMANNLIAALFVLAALLHP